MNTLTTHPALLRHLPWWLRLHTATVLVFLYLPVITLVVFSFSNSPSAMQWGGFTTKWYAQLSENARLLRAAGNSALVATISTAIGLLLGVPAAIGHASLRRHRTRVAASLLLPIIAPDVVVALALKLWCLTAFALAPGLTPMILGHSLLSLAYVFLLVSARLDRFDWRLLDAARDLGASTTSALRLILFPHLWPAIAGGALLAIGVSLDEYVISSFLSGPGSSTVPIETASLIRKTFTPEINALASALLALSACLAAAAILLQRRR